MSALGATDHSYLHALYSSIGRLAYCLVNAVTGRLLFGVTDLSNLYF